MSSWRVGTNFFVPHMCQVFITLGCHNKIHRQGGINNRNLFSHNYGGWKFETTVPAWLSSSEHCLSSLQMTTFWLCPHTVGREFLSSSYKTTNTIRLECHSYDLI